MAARILFFGATAELAGTCEMEIGVAAGLTATKVLENLVKKMPCLAAHKLCVSHNHLHATGDEIIRDGDEIGIFTAVSGG